LGPHRVFPGRLSVCRTFGDIEAKAERLLGNPKVVISEPDICRFKIQPDRHDFIIIGCDGIFDKLDDKDCVHTVWQTAITKKTYDQSMQALQKASQQEPHYNHSLCGLAVDSVMKTTAVRRSADNITVVFVAFDNFFNLVRESKGNI
jgi:protein phosphatase 2C family protein 2/3